MYYCMVFSLYQLSDQRKCKASLNLAKRMILMKRVMWLVHWKGNKESLWFKFAGSNTWKLMACGGRFSCFRKRSLFMRKMMNSLFRFRQISKDLWALLIKLWLTSKLKQKFLGKIDWKSLFLNLENCWNNNLSSLSHFSNFSASLCDCLMKIDSTLFLLWGSY